jgi:hypothetical protein
MTPPPRCLSARWLAPALLLSACAATTAASGAAPGASPAPLSGEPSGAPSAPAAAPLAPLALPAILVAPAGTPAALVCPDRSGPPGAPAPPTLPPPRRVVYDFESLVVEPLPWGPRLAERPADGLPRSTDELRAALAQRAEALSACYRWARWAAPRLEGRVTVAGTVDPWGRLAVRSAESWRAAGGPLADCVRDVLDGLALPGVTPGVTEARFELRLCPSDQLPAARRPPRPRPPPPSPEPPPVCVPADAPAGTLAPDRPLALVSDHDPERPAGEALRDCERRCRERCTQGRRQAVAEVHGSLVVSTCHPRRHPDRQGLLRTLQWNLGAWRACYVEALARRPDLAGTATFELRLGRGGEVAALELSRSTLADAETERCLQAAFASAVFDLPRGPAAEFLEPTLFVPLELRPVPAPAPLPAAPAERAAAALARGDGPTAAAAYAALVQAEPAHPETCARLAGLVRALRLAEPWGGARTEAAVRTLQAHAAANPHDAALPACLDEVARPLQEWATVPHQQARRDGPTAGYAEAARRYRLLLELPPPPPHRDAWRRLLAYALWEQLDEEPVEEELFALLTTIVREDPDPERRAEALELTPAPGQRSSRAWPECR